MRMRNLGLVLVGAALAVAASVIIGWSDVDPHHVKILKDYGGNVSFLDGPTWKYTGVTVTGADYWDGRIWIDLPLDRSSEAKEVYQTADGALLVDMNVAFLPRQICRRAQEVVCQHNRCAWHSQKGCRGHRALGRAQLLQCRDPQC